MKTQTSASAEERSSGQARCETHSPQRILLVDDDRSIRQIGVDVLIHSGYDVDAAEDGSAAWEALHADHYDLLITDNNMPNITGIDLVEQLRAAHMKLPVIMATGALPMLELTRRPWLQPAAALIKPYSPEELLGAVRMVLRDTDSSRERTDPRPYWRSHTLVGG